MPPRSSVVHVDSGLRDADGRGAGAIGAAVEEGWPFAPSGEEVSSREGSEKRSSAWGVPFRRESGKGGGFALGFVMGIAALAEFRVAMAEARAR